MSLKWLKVTASMQKHSHTVQEASYSKKSTRKKTLTYVSQSHLSSNPLNLQFCGYNILNTFAVAGNVTQSLHAHSLITVRM